MRLKTLELKGFKSFANDTVIHFDEDVIGIVGPNGSGKSNIVDAIRWVLGEQKGKELRLDSMGDVLFNGTKKRKAGKVAQVSITFENTRGILPTEYNTVTISRLLYRSGESEYRLNGVTCRLKDITALLMDTGIGSNSYAIIALGMVDDILHNKENARRRMFEQAAGVSKYKRRKHETLLKLKNTTADLDRVEDLLYEIETNLKMLEKQARRTKRFQEIKEQYKQKSIDLAVRKAAHLHEKHNEIGKQIETEKDLLVQLESDLNKTEAKLQQVKKEHLDEEKAVSVKQRELNILVGEIRSLENDKNLKEQETSFLQQSVKKLKASVEQNSELIGKVKAELNEKYEKMRIAAEEAKQLKADLEEALKRKQEVELEYNQAKQRREDAGSVKRGLEDEYIDMERKISSLSTRMSELQSLISNLESERKEVSTDARSKTDEGKVLKARLDQLQSELDEAIRREEDRKKRREEITMSKEEDKASLSEKQRKYDALKNERDLLKDMIHKLEGYPESIKFLSKSKEWKVNAPLLSDIVYCEQEYRPLVEYLLAPYLNDFVVATKDDASRAISLLRDSQKGRAEFIILDRIKTLAIHDTKPRPGVTPALELIQCDKEYLPLLKVLLHDVYITEKQPQSADFEGPDYEGCTLIHASGSPMVNRTGMAGGSIGLFEGKKLGRLKRVEKLEEELHKLETEIVRIRERIGERDRQLEINYAEDLSAEIERRRKELQSVAQQYTHTSAVSEKLAEAVEENDRRKEQAGKTLEQVKAEHSITIQALNELKRKMQEDASDWNKADQQYAQMIEAFSAANASYNQANLRHVEQRNLLETLEREIQYSGKRVQEIQDAINRDRKQIDVELNSIGEIEADLGKMQAELIGLYGKKKQEEEHLSSAEQVYFSARNIIHDLEEKIRNKSRERQNSEYLINQLKENLNDFRFKIASISERLDIEFHVKLDQVADREIDMTGALEALEVVVDRLRGRIENYGEINPMAVEAYDEMKERYDTINAQKEDILEAKASLIQTIQEIEETATQQFLDAFDRVREAFIDVFRSLFTEDDTCDLLLSDPENPLECDIQIIAKPKGKRPKSLSQLSGGEKTLTAVALLFALYLLKPAPFCVFDEVDAPLDDANIHKFNRIIKKFSKDSQFVVVTHNKQTMAAVDVMYGVYMEEQGISSLSPVDFRYFGDEAVLEQAEA